MEIKFSKKELSKLADKYQIKLIMLFGSFASGTERQGSDFDVAVLGDLKTLKEKEPEIINELSSVLEKDIDLSIVNIADPLLKFQVAKNSKMLFGKESEYTDFRVRSILENMDNRVFYDLEAQYLNQKYK